MSTRIDVDALISNFDEKRERLATNPIGRTQWRAGAAHFTLIERHLAKKPIMRGRQHANFPWPNPPHISGCHRIAGRSACSFRKFDELRLKR